MNPIRVEPDTSYKAFNEYLDDYYGKVSICDDVYHASDVLRKINIERYEQFFEKWKEVGTESYSKWECGICGQEFDSEDEAGECCEDEFISSTKN